MSETKQQIANPEAAAAIDECRQWLGSIANSFESHYADLGGSYFIEFMDSSHGEIVAIAKRFSATHSHEPFYVLEAPRVQVEHAPARAVLMPPLERSQQVWAERVEQDATIGTFILECLKAGDLRPVCTVPPEDPQAPLQLLEYPLVAARV